MSQGINCEECGAPYETKRKNAKFCRTCQLVRDMRFNWGKDEQCIICDKLFAPLTRSPDPFCGHCDTLKSSLHSHGDCAVCSAKDVTLLHKDIAVCLPCSTDIEKRPIIFKALVKKQQANKEKDHPKIGVHVTAADRKKKRATVEKSTPKV